MDTIREAAKEYANVEEVVVEQVQTAISVEPVNVAMDGIDEAKDNLTENALPSRDRQLWPTGQYSYAVRRLLNKTPDSCWPEQTGHLIFFIPRLARCYEAFS